MNVAITGHQNLGTADTARWVAEALASVVDRICVTRGYTCLAKGADQLFAEVLREKGLPIVVVIPCARIESSFPSEEDRIEFRRLLGTASETVQMPFDAPSEAAYFEAGKAVVDRSDVLLAVWNGQPAKGLGGTGDIVRYALEQNRSVIQVNLVSRHVSELRVKPETFGKPELVVATNPSRRDGQ